MFCLGVPYIHVIFDLSCGFFSFMILHCGDGIRHVEAVLEEPTQPLAYTISRVLTELGL